MRPGPQSIMNNPSTIPGTKPNTETGSLHHRSENLNKHLPPSFLIVRPMRELLRAVPSAVLSIRTFSALKNEILWNIKCRRTFLTCQRSLFRDLYHLTRWRFEFGQNKWKEFSFTRVLSLVWMIIHLLLSQATEETSSSSSRNPLCSLIPTTET